MIEYVVAVWKHSQARGTDLLVLLALADLADEHGVSWPSVGFLADRARIARRSVQRNVRALEQLGELEVVEKGGGRRANHYRIALELLVEGRQNGAAEVAPESGQGRQNVTSGVSPVSPVPVKDTDKDPLKREPAQESGKRRTVARRPVTPDEWAIASAALDEFNQYAGTAFTIDAHYVPIVGRIREHPQLTADEHRAIVAAAFRRPWWQDEPGPQVVYGNARVFEQAVERWRKTGGRRRGAPASPHPAEPVAGEGELLERLRAAFESLGGAGLHVLQLRGAHLHEPAGGRPVLASPTPGWLRERYSEVIADVLGPHEVVCCDVENPTS